MSRRMYFLLPDVPMAKTVVNELLLQRIAEKQIHVLAKNGTPMEDLPEASLLQKSDFIHGVEQGIAVGGVTGILAGLTALAFPPAGLIFGGGAVLATSLFGAGVGAWISGMIATDVPNTKLTEFESAIEAGQILMMVDVPKDKVEGITQMVVQHHPEADMHGVEATIPAFP